MRPRGLQEAPKRPPTRRPGSKRPLRGPQEAPRRSPEASKTLQEAPGTAKRPPRRPKRPPRGSQKTSQETPRGIQEASGPSARPPLLLVFLPLRPCARRVGVRKGANSVRVQLAAASAGQRGSPGRRGGAAGYRPCLQAVFATRARVATANEPTVEGTEGPRGHQGGGRRGRHSSPADTKRKDDAVKRQ